MKRYPVQPLLDACGLTLNAFIRTHMPSINGTYYRKARDEGLTADAADRWATRVGLHPFNVWPEMVEDSIEAAKVTCAAEDCDTRFLPSNGKHRFCSHRCSARESSRRRYRENAEVRERRKAWAKQWRAENERAMRFWASRQPEARREQSQAYRDRHAERINAAKRERYRANPELYLERQRAYDRARKEDAA